MGEQPAPQHAQQGGGSLSDKHGGWTQAKDSANLRSTCSTRQPSDARWTSSGLAVDKPLGSPPRQELPSRPWSKNYRSFVDKTLDVPPSLPRVFLCDYSSRRPMQRQSEDSPSPRPVSPRPWVPPLRLPGIDEKPQPPSPSPGPSLSTRSAAPEQGRQQKARFKKESLSARASSHLRAWARSSTGRRRPGDGESEERRRLGQEQETARGKIRAALRECESVHALDVCHVLAQDMVNGKRSPRRKFSHYASEVTRMLEVMSWALSHEEGSSSWGSGACELRHWRRTLHQMVEQEVQHRRFALSDRSGAGGHSSREEGGLQAEEEDREEAAELAPVAEDSSKVSRRMSAKLSVVSRLSKVAMDSGPEAPASEAAAAVDEGSAPNALSDFGETSKGSKDRADFATPRGDGKRSTTWARAAKSLAVNDVLTGRRATVGGVVQRNSMVRRGSKGAADASEPLSEEEAAKRETWKRAFGRVAKGQRVLREDLRRAFEIAGFQHVKQEHMDQAFTEVSFLSSVGQDEFMRVVELYATKQEETMDKAFEEADEDGSGAVDVHELKAMVKSLGHLPSKELLQELMDQVDEDDLGELDRQGFARLMTLLMESQGFTSEERSELGVLFGRFDPTGAGAIEPANLAAAITYMGNNGEDARAIIDEVSAEGGFDAHEWLICHRKACEKERQRYSSLFEEIDEGETGSLTVLQLQRLLDRLGLLVERETIMEIAEEIWRMESEGDAGDGPERERGFSEEDVQEFLRMYRNRDGLSTELLDSVQRAMARYAHDGSVRRADSGKVLRSFGYTLSWQEQQRLLDSSDVPLGGDLQARDVRKLLRKLQQEELRRMRDVFDRRDSHRRGVISPGQAKEALADLKILDQLPPDVEAVPASCREGLDRDAFVALASGHAKLARESYKQNAGYSASELVSLRKSFQSVDADQSGAISNSELAVLVKSIFPTVTPRLKKTLEAVMQDVEQQDGELDFQDFVRLVRQFDDLQQEERADKERTAVLESEFSPSEVSDFRDLFQEATITPNADPAPLQLPVTGLMSLLGNICSLSQRDEAMIINLVKDVKASYDVRTPAARKSHVQLSPSSARRTSASLPLVANPLESRDLGELSVDFPEFIRIMKELLDTNFGGLNAKAHARAQQRQA